MGRVHRTIGAMVVMFLVAATPAAAGGVGHWTQITSKTQDNSGVIGNARTKDGVLHVAWAREATPSSDSLYMTQISPHGSVTSVTPILSNWASARDPALVVGPGGGLELFFPGVRTRNSSEPLDGMIMATPSKGAWGFTNIDSRTDDFGYGRTPGATIAPGGAPVLAWYNDSQPVVRLVSPVEDAPATPFGGPWAAGAAGVLENLATDPGRGQIMLAWCQFDGGPIGIRVQAVDPSTGAPAGHPLQMPGSVSTYQGKRYRLCDAPDTQPTALTARNENGFYVAATAGYPSSSKVLVWHVGDASSTTVAFKPGQDLGRPQLATAPNGRLWVGWLDSSGNVFLRRSNLGATRWGAPVKVRPPKGTDGGFELHLSAQDGAVDVLARFESLHDIEVFHTQANPGLTFSASPTSFKHKAKHTIHFRVVDAGDPVSGAKIDVDGKSATTNGQGEATIDLGPFSGRRKLAAKATKDGYTRASLTLHAR